jgi:tRNA modification GTPase
MDEAIRVSTLLNTGMHDLKQAMLESLTDVERLKDPVAVSNLRHVLLLKETRATLAGARAALKEQATPEEFVLVDLQRARAALAEIVGAGSSEETLDYIFSHFCIGK